MREDAEIFKDCATVPYMEGCAHVHARVEERLTRFMLRMLEARDEDACVLAQELRERLGE